MPETPQTPQSDERSPLYRRLVRRKEREDAMRQIREEEIRAAIAAASKENRRQNPQDPLSCFGHAEHHV